MIWLHVFIVAVVASGVASMLFMLGLEYLRMLGVVF
jgi:hypothetical protein